MDALEKKCRVQVAHRQNSLWPSIHTALDAYLRRKASAAGDFELIWRLIHIWECATITLASLAITWQRNKDQNSPDYLVFREKCYGLTSGEQGTASRSGIGAFDGSIDKWIEILVHVSKMEDADSNGFLGKLRQFLIGCNQKSGADCKINLAKLLESWDRVCGVSGISLTESLVTIAAIRAINQFRNRFAHVPFPHDRVKELAAGLEAGLVEFFHFGTEGGHRTAPLCGSIVRDGIRLSGSCVELASISTTKGKIFFVHGGTDDSSERWIADPFVHIDDMGRPYVLTRLRNEEGLWEYTRFLAEANSIIEINDPQIFESFRRPSPEEYSAPETEVKDQLEYVRSGDLPDIQALRTEGLTALRRGDYDATIQTFSQIVELRPALHVVWLQLGHARRNKAWDLVHSGEFGAAREQARKAIESYEKAPRHSSLSHRASAVYSISKTAWMLYKYLSDSSYKLDDIIKLARDAYELYPEDKHHTWIEFLESYGGPNAASG